MDRASSQTAALGPDGRSWFLPLVLATGAIFVAFQVVHVFGEHEFGRSLRQQDVSRAEQALDRLGLIMRDSYHLRRDLGFLAKDNGQLDTAIRAFERSVELRPSPRAWYEKARLHGVRDEWALAAESYEGAYALAPFPAPYIAEFVQALVQAGRREQALQILNDGLKKFPRNPSLLKARGEFAAETR